MSQLFPRAHESVLDALPFAKFSHATCAYDVSTFTWCHVSGRDDLRLVFHAGGTVDKHGNHVESLVMDIHAGAELLESQDLGELVELSKGFGSSTEPARPVQVVIKCPCLAMRYPKPGNIVRRIQLRFRNESDFNRALNVLNHLGLPTLDNISAEQSRSCPVASPVPSMVSSTSTSSTGTIVPSMPRLAPHNMPSYEPVKQSFDVPPLPFPPSDFKVPFRADHPCPRTLGPLGTLPFSTSSTIRPASASTGPATRHPSLYLSQIEQQHRRISQPFMQSSILGQSNSSMRSRYFAPESGSQPGQMSEETDSMSRALSTSPFLLPKSNPIHSEGSPLAVASFVNPFNQGSKAQPDSGRPYSAPITQPHIQSLSIPPRRELPFPTSPQKSTPSPVSALPLLPKPTPIKSTETPIVIRGTSSVKETTSTHKHVENRVAQHKTMCMTSSVKPQDKSLLNKTAPFEVSNNDELVSEGPAVPQEVASPLAIKITAASSGLPTTTTGLQSKPKTVRKRNAAPARQSLATKRLKMMDQGTQTQTLSGRDHTVMQRSTPAIDENAPTLSLPSADHLDTLDKFVHKYNGRPRPTELWEAPGYIEASEEQRDILLADFVCDNLDNPEFLQLCQDAERAWCRIGLGV
ncbi:uncharacterized protein BP5553_04477 [Venustampulla echinocandica]|uniref:Uncharacterized protein n=1 Tax=Venustampulla echinocandica TaxID=2656787 RepID=A0A370TNF4_9HELO|nr:uncharacterized protein BP5553_04477 [Venustampulla echinocandica]RDL37044.1 hypothetical protein BP5553_04477 [Venustampulla echinocandica]